MNHIIIRTCKRDDYLAKLCYYSFKDANIDGTYTFIADKDQYNHINKTCETVLFKEKSDNYGGQFGAKSLLNSLKQFKFLNDDIIIISDSDIIVFNNFIKEINNYDHCGVGGINDKGLHHISGQMQIFNGTTINKLINLTIQEIDNNVKEMVSKNMDVADDTFNSYMTDKWNCKKKILNNKNWIHYKAYEYENMEYADAIKMLKEKFNES